MSSQRAVIEVFEYTQDTVGHFRDVAISDLKSLLNSPSHFWINVEGLQSDEEWNALSDILNLHPLVQENARDMAHSPRLEEYDEHIFITLKMLSFNAPTEDVLVEHLNLVISNNYVITFQEGLEGDVFAPIRDRLNRSKTRVRSKGPDYLAYAILDVVIDNYIYIIEMFGERLERLEQQFPSVEGDELLNEIYEYKMQINFLRKTIRPVREIAVLFEKCDADMIDESNTPFFNSLITHMTHCTEAIETYQIMLNDQLFLYQTKTSNRLNDILRILTIFSVIFIPLTFIAGVYGTNFKYLPELNFKYAYPLFWLLLISVATFMLLYFKRKKWI